MAKGKGARERIEELRQSIRRHDRLYYVLNQPEVSDREFDALMEELRRLEGEHPELVTPDSPTQKVGGQPLDEFSTAAHLSPMLSIDNTYNEEEVREFDRRIRRKLGADARTSYVVEPKIDGVAMNLIYRDGALAQAITRGDGERGDDVTQNARTVRDLPLSLCGPDGKVDRSLCSALRSGLRRAGLEGSTIEVRGEVYMSFAAFREVNAEREAAGEMLFANPRNATAGSLKLLDPSLTARRRLRLFTYEIGAHEGVQVPGSHWERLGWLRDHGCPTNPEARRCAGVDEVLALCRQWEKRVHQLEYPLDGLVVKVDDVEQRVRLDRTSKAWSWMVAYKFAAEQQVTRVKKIEVNVGKTGQLTPVAVLEPVQLAGTTVSRASLHNFDELERKDVRVGDHVLVEKAGEIIPQVVKVLTDLRTGDEKEVMLPAKCPSCDGPVRREESDKKKCLDEKCPGATNLRTRRRVPIDEDRCDVCGGKVEVGRILADTQQYKRCTNKECDLYAKNKQRPKVENNAKGPNGVSADSKHETAYVPLSQDNCSGCGCPVEVGKVWRKRESTKMCMDRSCAAHGRLVARPFVRAEEDECADCGRPVTASFALFCDNPRCPAQRVGRVTHFGSRGTMDIEGLGEALARQLVEEGLVQDVGDLYSLQKDKVAALEGMAEKSSQNLIDAIAASKDRDLSRLLFALGIPNVGSHLADVLARQFRSLDKLRRAGGNELQQVEEVGPVVAKAIVEFFLGQSTGEILDKLTGAGVNTGSQLAAVEEKPAVADKTFVLTGALERHTRQEATRLIESRGGRVTGSVSSKTDFVVIGAKPGSSVDEARRLGVRTLSEEEFEALLGTPREQGA